MQSSKMIGVGLLAVLPAACAAPRPHAAAVPCAQALTAAPQAPLPGMAYRIDPSRSELRLLVYRAGPMARLGHNHVLVNRALCGAAGVTDPPGGSVFWMTVPVADFVVDDAQARSEEGPDFAAEVAADAKAGTLQHMLGTALLDADEFPVISVRGEAASAAPAPDPAAPDPAAPDPAAPDPAAPDPAAPDPAPSSAPGTAPGTTQLVKVTLVVAGHESAIEVPVTLRFDADRLVATGSVDIRQSALGLTPYSTMMGALQVQDAMTVKFKFSATRAAGKQ